MAGNIGFIKMTSLSVLVARQFQKTENQGTCDNKEARSAATQAAKNMFFEDIHPYFAQQWGDYWLSKFQGTNKQCEFSKVWIHSIVGLSKADVARAIVAHTSTDNAQYPPTPLRLRQLAVSSREDFNSLNLEILNSHKARD